MIGSRPAAFTARSAVSVASQRYAGAAGSRSSKPAGFVAPVGAISFQETQKRDGCRAAGAHALKHDRPLGAR